MATDPEVTRCLELLGERSEALARELSALSAAEWDGPTNCAPWRMRDLAGHIVISGEGFVANIRRGLAGSAEPGISEEERQRRQAELASAGPETVARAVQAVTVEFAGLYDGLQADELAAICYHRRGNRSVRWYAAHRLAEVAFHAWDVQVSLGRAPELDEAVAALLLPTLLESNAPRTYAAGLTPQRGAGERYLLALDEDTAWLITIHPDKLETQRSGTLADHTGTRPADDPGRLSITGSAAALALLVYGRIELRTLSASGAVRVRGDQALVDRFRLIFPRP